MSMGRSEPIGGLHNIAIVLNDNKRVINGRKIRNGEVLPEDNKTVIWC